eukprot:4842873-Lingulodinium_polyedra.AAC.1
MSCRLDNFRSSGLKTFKPTLRRAWVSRAQPANSSRQPGARGSPRWEADEPEAEDCELRAPPGGRDKPGGAGTAAARLA